MIGPAEIEEGIFMRVTEHPIINEFPKGRLVTFEYDGKPMEGYEGEPIAMALKSNGVEIHRYTTKLHKPRGLQPVRTPDVRVPNRHLPDGKPDGSYATESIPYNRRIHRHAPSYVSSRWR